MCGGIFNSFDETSDNIEYIKNGKVFANNDIKINEYIGEVYRVLKERNSRIYL